MCCANSYIECGSAKIHYEKCLDGVLRENGWKCVYILLIVWWWWWWCWEAPLGKISLATQQRVKPLEACYVLHKRAENASLMYMMILQWCGENWWLMMQSILPDECERKFLLHDLLRASIKLNGMNDMRWLRNVLDALYNLVVYWHGHVS